jgi:hypothetical protein
MSLGLYNARSCRVRDQHRIRARNQDSEIAGEEIRDQGIGFSDSDRRANSYANTDSYANSHSHADSYANAHFNSYGDGYGYCRAEVYAVAQAAAHATSAPISSSV